MSVSPPERRRRRTEPIPLRAETPELKREQAVEIAHEPRTLRHTDLPVGRGQLRAAERDARHEFRYFDPDRCGRYSVSTLKAIARKNGVPLPSSSSSEGSHTTRAALCETLRSEWDRRHALAHQLLQPPRRPVSPEAEVEEPPLEFSTSAASALALPASYERRAPSRALLPDVPVVVNIYQQQQEQERALRTRLDSLEQAMRQLQVQAAAGRALAPAAETQAAGGWSNAVNELIRENQNKQLTLEQLQEAVTRLAEKQRAYAELSAQDDLAHAHKLEQTREKLRSALDILQNLAPLLAQSAAPSGVSSRADGDGAGGGDGGDAAQRYGRELLERLQSLDADLQPLPAQLRAHAQEQQALWRAAADSGLVRTPLAPDEMRNVLIPRQPFG